MQIQHLDGNRPDSVDEEVVVLNAHQLRREPATVYRDEPVRAQAGAEDAAAADADVPRFVLPVRRGAVVVDQLVADAERPLAELVRPAPTGSRRPAHPYALGTDKPAPVGDCPGRPPRGWRIEGSPEIGSSWRRGRRSSHRPAR